ncbi:tetraacyldisaccharide 4'-kinase [Alteromonas sp. C1M14]|uniref:tetraacyldisaccharide 4'-kinase n=1 Tax=Alteromonas sp. C1M14 TaxID=2841567 RepID=UPI001C0A2750|nr:tetraacyldisaccharide 4'-kinase [Alteromonas sp. C1M14]MBU2976983.1 tetraacyldisaccharide 4'-kinase [Alteromonas sp. C1M14]
MHIDKMWYTSDKRVWLLWPLTLLFGLLSCIRRWLYRVGIKKRHQGPAFTIVVGNITVGGNGKTPVVIALVEYFKSQGIAVGVLSRGFGGSQTHFPHHVQASNRPDEVGDEPKLIAARTDVPVVIDPKRARGADHLAHVLGCDVIVCDDGLQHYGLHRDVELVVMDNRGVGNGHLLPMGPLREGLWRLDTVHGIIINGDKSALSPAITQRACPVYQMALKGNQFVNLKSGERVDVGYFNDKKSAVALAGIGNPQRFFSHLSSMGLVLDDTFVFPDHHVFSAADIPTRTVLMTEKDAVKVAPLAHHDCWYLPVDAQLPPSFYTFIDTRLSAADIAFKKDHL